MGHGRRRRRRDGTGRGGGRRDTRPERRMPRKERLRQVHFEPFDQTRARRRALPPEGRRAARARGVARARPHEGQRTASGQGPGIRHLELQPLGQRALLLRTRVLRPAFVRFRLRTFEIHLGEEGAEIPSHVGGEGAEGRRGLPRRAVRRLAHGRKPRTDLRRTWRHGPQPGHRDRDSAR